MDPLYLLAMPILIAVAGFWYAISWLIAQLGGWRRLAKAYRTTREPPAEIYNFCSGTLNRFAHYNFVLRIGFLPEGLYLAVWPYFVFGHPPLLIPYADITPANSATLFRTITIGNPKIATLYTSSRIVKKIEERKKML